MTTPNTTSTASELAARAAEAVRAITVDFHSPDETWEVLLNLALLARRLPPVFSQLDDQVRTWSTEPQLPDEHRTRRHSVADMVTRSLVHHATPAANEMNGRLTDTAAVLDEAGRSTC